MKNSLNDMQDLPGPSSNNSGIVKLAIITCLTVAITAGGIFWLTSDDLIKGEISTAVQKNVETIIKDTPLEEVKDYIAPPPPPPAAITNPPTEPGTLAGQSVQSPMSAPTDGDVSLGPKAEDSTEDSADATDQDSVEAEEGEQSLAVAPDASEKPVTPMAPKVNQDTRVPLSFVEDVAGWLVGRYTPGKGVNLNVSALNLRYGQNMRTLMPEGSKDTLGERASLLRYAFNPTMMTALYNLYADRFLLAMHDSAVKEGITSNNDLLRISNMYKAYAHEFTILAAVFEGIGRSTGFLEHMQSIDDLTNRSLDIHTELTEAVFALDTAREAKDETAQNTAQLRIDGLNAQYRRAIAERDTARRDLIRVVTTKAPLARNVDGDTVLFIAEWLERRGNEENIMQSAATAAQLLGDMSSRLTKAARAPHE